ncbi:hypothetical protein BKN49_05255 [Pseudomonas aeruginosa]|nr:hypothetical protein BKN49_05255 [Pseudomonas aeruginosa]
MKLNKILAAIIFAGFAFTSVQSHAVEVIDKGSEIPTEKDAVEDTSESPWARRMEDVTGLFGVEVRGDAASVGGGINNVTNFSTFQPWQEDSFRAVGAYGSSQVGFGCDGMNLGGVIDGQLAQYGTMIEEFISQAPALAIMYLAYSQPVVKAVIDEMNIVGQFGLDLSNMTCSGVRNLADKSYEEKMVAVAEADCTADAGYKDANCISGQGVQTSLLKGMREAKAAATSRAGSLLGGVSNATGGFIQAKSSAASSGGGSSTGGNSGTGGGNGGSGTGSNGSTGGNTGLVGKNCSGVDADAGTTPLILGASEMNCKDIKKYSGLLPTYVIEEDAQEVVPRKLSVETLSKEITEEHMDLLSSIYQADPKTFTNNDAYKNLVNRADVVISRQELLAMQEMARKSPALAVRAQRQMATLSMMKELEIIISKLEIGVESGLSNQIDQQYISDRMVGQYGSALRVMRKEYELLQAKIAADQARSMALNNILSQTGG